MFSIGDIIMCPTHGAGKIENIEERDTSSGKVLYFDIRIIFGNMRVFIPCSSPALRPIISEKEAKAFLAALKDIEITDNNNWSKRYRENAERLRSGKIEDSASVYKYLHLRSAEKGLSAGERKMYQSVKGVIVSELMISLSVSMEEAERMLLRAV